MGGWDGSEIFEDFFVLLIWFCRNAQICCTNKEISQYMELCLKNFCIYKINVLNESKFCVPYLPK